MEIDILLEQKPEETETKKVKKSYKFNKPPKDMSRDEREAYYEYMRQKDRETVKGIFRFYEVPGGNLSFNFKIYKKDPVEKFSLNDGQVYSLPLGVAKHLNKNGWYPVHAYLTDENGNKVMKVGQKIRRFSFQSLEFVDIDDLTEIGSSITTVEQIGL